MEMINQIVSLWPVIGLIVFFIFTSLACRVSDQPIQVTFNEMLLTALIMCCLGPVAIPVAFKMLKDMQ